MVWLVGGVITVKVLKTQEHDCNILYSVSLFLFLANKVLFIKSIKINVLFFLNRAQIVNPARTMERCKNYLECRLFCKRKIPIFILKKLKNAFRAHSICCTAVVYD